MLNKITMTTNRNLLIAILLFPASMYAQTFTMPVQVNMGGSGLADRAPMMKLDRNGNIFVAWVRGSDGMGNGPIAMTSSTDGGATFSMPSVVCADANCNSNFQRTAQFVIDTKGNIHLVWMGSRVNSQPDIWYTRSIDKGKTWTKPVSVCDADDSSKYAQDFPSIACDSNDNVYVSFLDMRMTQRKLAKTPLLYFTRSTDGGMTWSVNKRADVPPGGIGGTCECCSQQMASTADGHIYITYRSDINNIRDIWLARSYDKGMTFQPALKLSTGDWTIYECPVTGPHIALDGSEDAHIVWRDSRDDSGKVHLYYAFVANGSNETPVNTAFDADGAQTVNYADIALYDQGKYRAITYQTSNYGMRYILTNTNSPLVYNRPVNVNGNSAKSFANVLFNADDTRYLCWQDDKNDAGDIYFAKETSPLTSASVKNNNFENNFSIYPNPISKGNPSFTIHRESGSPATLKLVDLLGREISSIPLGSETSQIVTLPNITPGVYYFSLGDGSLPRKIVIGQ